MTKDSANGSAAELSPASKHTVLLVDDDPDVSRMYAEGLSAAGFVVTVAANARAALSAIKYELPEVVVLDWQMPEMRGDELLDLLARDGTTRNLPVLFLSNFPSDRLRAAGADAARQTIGWLVKSKTTPHDLANRLLIAVDGNVEPRTSFNGPQRL